VTNFQEAVIALDAALTGSSHETAALQLRCLGHQIVREFTPRQFRRGDAYYMSDGGYSRLICDPDDGSVFLSFVSLDRVKAKWDECSELVKAVEVFTKAATAAV